MKKILVSLVLIGASALYIFTRPTDATTAAVGVPAGNTDTNGITISPLPAVPSTPPPSIQTPAPKTTTPTPKPVPAPRTSVYKDGTFTGSVADAFYGLVQVQATIKNGLITNVNFLSYPNDRSTSRFINSQATPLLAQEAIQAQSANVNIVSGATQTSLAFNESLGVALASAKN